MYTSYSPSLALLRYVGDTAGIPCAPTAVVSTSGPLPAGVCARLRAVPAKISVASASRFFTCRSIALCEEGQCAWVCVRWWVRGS